MTTIAARAYQGETDMAAIERLVEHCDSFDNLDETLDRDRLRRDLNNPQLDHPNYRNDLNLVAVAPDGTLAAFCYSKILNPATQGERALNDPVPTLLFAQIRQ
jgi:hypothetical protein